MPIMCHWHKVVLECPNCKKEPTIVALYGCGDGELMMDLICVSCGTQLQWKTDHASMIRSAYNADLIEHQAKQHPTQAPLALPPPTFTDQDLKELKDFHILDDDQEAA